uniref:Putative secreted protein n=1 Tax=Xenopsylla cheopis TaxID=163159 RepID=A0A6M2DVU7_XENCH
MGVCLVASWTGQALAAPQRRGRTTRCHRRLRNCTMQITSRRGDPIRGTRRSMSLRYLWNHIIKMEPRSSHPLAAAIFLR